ncbi:hypothetical protein Hokovirus_2_21 [Hokovirus HKV1]|uniref:Protein kinase domain-containing protein n=1 Tax=Hokovirus HKV1 TaxID=1977638 RepID=A0A1V0SFS3_9VIRU|nr:hypothetical protein Hokovirus_2_21 [Hokovirus HKV1]
MIPPPPPKPLQPPPPPKPLQPLKKLNINKPLLPKRNINIEENIIPTYSFDKILSIFYQLFDFECNYENELFTNTETPYILLKILLFNSLHPEYKCLNKIQHDMFSRYIFSYLAKHKIININLDCDAIENLLSQGKKIPKNSASASIQYINIKNINNYINININIEETLKIFKANMQEDHDDNIFVAIKYINRYIRTQNLLFFGKLNIMTTTTTDMTTHNQKIEICFYKYLTNLLSNKKIANIAAYFYDKMCPYQNENEIKNDFATQENNLFFNKIYSTHMKSYDNNNKIIDPYNRIVGKHLLLTEMMNATSLSSILKNGNITNDEFNKIIFQVFYTLLCFANIKFNHNDLHFGNIFIENISENHKMIYINNEQAYVLNTSYYVKIYDFDRSCMFIDGSELYANYSSTCQDQEAANMYDFVKQKNMFMKYTTNDPKNPIPKNTRENIQNMLNNVFNNVSLPDKNDIHKFFNNVNQLNLLHNNIINYFKKTNTIQIFDTASIPYDILVNSDIYMHPSNNVDHIKYLISQNPNWNKLTSIQKFVSCYPLVNNDDILDIHALHIQIPNPMNNMFGGNSYMKKYLKYKKKYNNAKKNIY